MAIRNSTRNYALGILLLVYIFNFIDRQILAILLPAIKTEFNVNDWVLGFLAGPAFALFYSILGVPIAALADRYNRRNIIAAATAIWSLMTALSGVASSIVQLTIARIGVGIGEAGCSPPAHSIISDYFPPERRSIAMGIYTSGISIGIMIAYLAGGWVAENIGWREAFFIVGIPGLLLAVVVRLTMQEPLRGASEEITDTADVPGILETAMYLVRRPSFVHIAIGAALAALGGYAAISFFPTFLVRSHALSLSEIGVRLGLIYGIGGGLGFVVGGYVADKLGELNRKYSLWGVSVAMIGSWIFLFPVYLVDDVNWVLVVYVIPAVLSNFYLATTFAQVQGMVRLRMRAVASAVILLILNILGLGLGPLITGLLSDWMSLSFGVESMRYSLLIIGGIIGPWSALHFYLAGRHIDVDLSRIGN